MYWVYIIECRDGSLYTGITNDLKRRFKQHQDGKGGHYTRAREVVRFVYTQKRFSRSAALKREAEIKSWKREKKLDLIKNS
jgi:putative endonuclease